MFPVVDFIPGLILSPGWFHPRVDFIQVDFGAPPDVTYNNQQYLYLYGKGREQDWIRILDFLKTWIWIFWINPGFSDSTYLDPGLWIFSVCEYNLSNKNIILTCIQ